MSIAAMGQGPATIYFTDAKENPGKVYSSTASGSENVYFARPSGNIYTFSFHPYVPEKLYYVNANDNKIYLATKTTGGAWTTTDQMAYTHSTYIRDLEYYPTASGDLEVYFSESSGAGGDGQICQISERSHLDFRCCTWIFRPCDRSIGRRIRHHKKGNRVKCHILKESD